MPICANHENNYITERVRYRPTVPVCSQFSSEAQHYTRPDKPMAGTPKSSSLAKWTTEVSLHITEFEV